MTEKEFFENFKKCADNCLQMKGKCEKCGADLPDYPQYFEDWRGKVQVKICPKCGHRHETITRYGNWVKK